MRRTLIILGILLAGLVAMATTANAAGYADRDTEIMGQVVPAKPGDGSHWSVKATVYDGTKTLANYNVSVNDGFFFLKVPDKYNGKKVVFRCSGGSRYYNGEARCPLTGNFVIGVKVYMQRKQ